MNIREFWIQRRDKLKKPGRMLFRDPYKMEDQDKTKEQLVNDLLQMRRKIAELKVSEAERKRAEMELKQSEERYRSLVEDINDGYFILQDGKFVYFNQAFANLLGGTEEVILVREFSKIFSKKYQERISKDDLKGKEDHQEHLSQSEFEISRKDGKNLVLEIRFRVIDYNGRSAIGGICIDMTERKKTEMALREKVKELERWYRLTVDREVKMTELKKRIRELESKRKLMREKPNPLMLTDMDLIERRKKEDS